MFNKITFGILGGAVFVMTFIAYYHYDQSNKWNNTAQYWFQRDIQNKELQKGFGDAISDGSPVSFALMAEGDGLSTTTVFYLPKTCRIEKRPDKVSTMSFTRYSGSIGEQTNFKAQDDEQGVALLRLGTSTLPLNFEGAMTRHWYAFDKGDRENFLSIQYDADYQENIIKCYK